MNKRDSVRKTCRNLHSLNINSCWYSLKNWTDLPSSKNNWYALLMSSTSASCALRFLAIKLEVMMSCMPYRNEVSFEILVRTVMALSDIWQSSSSQRILQVIFFFQSIVESKYFSTRPILPEDLPELFLFVGLCRNDDGPIQKIQGYPMWWFIRGAPDLSNTAVRSHNYYGGHFVFQCPVQEGEALDVQHVDLKDH